jgi:hypothetical protein
LSLPIYPELTDAQIQRVVEGRPQTIFQKLVLSRRVNFVQSCGAFAAIYENRKIPKTPPPAAGSPTGPKSRSWTAPSATAA